MKQTYPTNEFYGMLTKAFDHFNDDLFSSALPHCLITVQREKNTMGYFSPNRWGNMKGNKTHEIALNPAYFAQHKIVEIFQTLVHEQCHLWQQVYGKPSRSGYHNKEWAEKMESIGLMPSDTGEIDGKKTGQKMSDYPIANGRFISSCKKLIKKGYQLNWVDLAPATQASAQIRETASTKNITAVDKILDTLLQDIIPNIVPTNQIALTKIKKSKIKYQCSCCKSNVWGKPNLQLLCNNKQCIKKFSTRSRKYITQTQDLL